MRGAIAKNGIIIGILIIIAIILVSRKPLNSIKEDDKVEKELDEVLDTVKRLHIDEGGDNDNKQPVVWIRIKAEKSAEMTSVTRVFERLGYRQGSQFSKWDTLWSHYDPFLQIKKLMEKISPHQKVNHIPGARLFKEKKNLVKINNIQSIPKTFFIPNEKPAFINYAKDYPDYLWVRKNLDHGGVKITTPEAVKLEIGKLLIQRFIDNPLLIDGKKFDIGIYVAVTSVDPLRIYMYDNDWVMRFCPENYQPFDPVNVKKYVVTEDSIPGYKMPFMKKLVLEKGFSDKEALLSHLRNKGYNDTKVLNNLYDSIKEVFMAIQQKLVLESDSYSSTRNFFDISKFEFIIDKDLNVHLMGVNTFPDLTKTSSNHNGHEILHDQVLYSFLTMIGIGKNTQDHFMISSNDSQQMMATERNIHVYSDLCVSSQCENNCQDIYCNLCSGCQNKDFNLDLKHTVMEHNHRGDWRRIIPRVFKDSMEAKNWDPPQDPIFQKSTTKNKQMAAWIRGKCMKDNRWCI